MCPIRLPICNIIGIVYFYNIWFQHLSLLVKSWGIRSVLEGHRFQFLSNIFPWEAPKLSESYISCQFPRELLRFFLRPILSTVSSLVARFLTFSCSSDGVLFGLWGILFLCSSCVIRDPNLLEGLLRDCKRCPGKYSSCLLLSSNCYIESIYVISSLLYDELNLVAIFPLCYVYQDRIK